MDTPKVRVTWSAERDKLAAALVKFQAAVEAVGKDKTAKVPTKTGGQYEYSYADLASIIDATREARTAAELAVVQMATGNERGVCVVTTVLHSSGQWVEGDFTMSPGDTRPQTIGSLITYLRRYSYSAALGISTEEDDDGAEAQKASAAKPEPHRAKSVAVAPADPKANRTQIARIHALKGEIGGMSADEHPGTRYRTLLRGYPNATTGKGCEHSTELTEAQATHLVAHLETIKAKQGQNARAALRSVVDAIPIDDDVPERGGPKAGETGSSTTTRATPTTNGGHTSKSSGGSQGTARASEVPFDDDIPLPNDDDAPPNLRRQ